MAFERQVAAIAANRDSILDVFRPNILMALDATGKRIKNPWVGSVPSNVPLIGSEIYEASRGPVDLGSASQSQPRGRSSCQDDGLYGSEVDGLYGHLAGPSL